jgi:hypothetical protein
MFYVDLYIINVYVILPPDLGPFAVNKYMHTNKTSTEKMKFARTGKKGHYFEKQKELTSSRSNLT